jgi:uncharacterized protein with von Willebrand factor type A (vWA) domain
VNRAIVVDRWDLPERERALSLPVFAAQRAVLHREFSPWGGDALDDIFFLLFLARPEVADAADVDGAHVVGHVLVSLLAANPTVRRLREVTTRDLVAAAAAAAKLAPQIAKAAAAVSPEMSAVMAAESQAAEDPEAEWLQVRAQERRRELVDKATEAAESHLDQFEQTAGAAAEREERMACAAEAFGFESGGLQRLSVAERLALARQLDTDTMRRIADLFGRLRMTMFAERAEVVGAGAEPVDVEWGGDVSRLLGAELLTMEIPELFAARLGDLALAQYQMQGTERVGHGGIVLCVDSSGSMRTTHDDGYTREMWASALKLFLLQVAIREHRSLHVINFGGPGELDYHRFVDATERTPLRALEAASGFFGYGTDFVGPLRKATEVLVEEQDRDCDVVFVSDGECPLSERERQRYRRVAKSRRLRTWGVQIGPQNDTLRGFCDRVFRISDLTSGRDLGDLLDAVEH